MTKRELANAICESLFDEYIKKEWKDGTIERLGYVTTNPENDLTGCEPMQVLVTSNGVEFHWMHEETGIYSMACFLAGVMHVVEPSIHLEYPDKCGATFSYTEGE